MRILQWKWRQTFNNAAVSRETAMKRNQFAVLILVGFLALATLGLMMLLQDPPLGFYLHWSMSPHALPARFIRPALRYATDRDMPALVRDARAIWSGGREPSIFLRFETDPNGFAHMEQTFGGPGTQSDVYSAEDMEQIMGSGGDFFPMAKVWQEALDLSMYDAKTLGAGRLVRYSEVGGEGWRIFIDEDRGVVYILAWSHT